MPSLIELVEKINAGDNIEPHDLDAYQESPNAAERFLAHHAGATLQLRSCHTHLYEALQAIDFADRKVLEQYVGLCGFLGREELTTAPLVQFGRSAIARGEPAVGLEAVAQAVYGDIARGWSWAADRHNGEALAEIYATAAQTIGWTPSSSGWSNTQTRIAYVVSSLADDEPAARAAAAFARTIDAKQFRLSVYSTEATCRRDRQQIAGDVASSPGSLKRGAATINRIKEAKAGQWLAPTSGPTGGDLSSAATALADQLVADQIDVLIVDADPSDAIAGVLCAWNVARAKLWIARRVPLFSTTINAVAYLDPGRCELDRGWWEQQGITATSLVEGVDLEAPVGEAPRRSAYGIPESAVILTTAADDVTRTVTPLMADAIIEVLKRHPNAVYLLVGGGDATPIRKRFDAAGVGKRVGYAGKRRDLPGFLKMADIYLAEFPEAAPTGVLQAMTMGLATVAMATEDADEGINAAEFVGSEATVGSLDVMGYGERVTRLIRDSAFRQQQGRAMRRRVEQKFAFDQTTRGIETLCGRLLAGGQAGSDEGVTLEEIITEHAQARKAA